MQLIFWRHAEAVDGMPDMERVLTDKGIKQAERMADFLRSRIPQDTRILVSPARRTQQTAESLSKHFITEPAIAPNANLQSLLKAANWPEGDGCVLIVGHQPTLGEAAALLLCNNCTSFSIKKGAVWWFTRHSRDRDNQTRLHLAISPDLL